MTHVVLLPLDDRPVNTGNVADLAAAAGATLTLPPPGLLGPRGAASDLDAVAAWLVEAAKDADAVVVSVNQLVHGGYVPSRRTGEGIADWLPRLEVLRRLPAEMPVFAYAVLMRTKDQDDASTEPSYWDSHGRAFFRFSQELYRAEHPPAPGQDGVYGKAPLTRPPIAAPALPAGAAGGRGAGPLTTDGVERARAVLPEGDARDWVRRRLALHQLHLACVELAAEGVLDHFAVLAEDTTLESVSTSEREWLDVWITRFGAGDRVMCYPGADEAGAVFFGRALGLGRDLTAAVVCEVPVGLSAVAVYEDVPVGETVAAQVRAAGLRQVPEAEAADLVVAVHPPMGTGDGEMADRYFDACTPASPERLSAARRLADRVAGLVAAGRRVVVADVADANGSDPALVDALRERIALTDLAGYAGWNTAGNSIGSAVAQGCAALAGGPGSTAKAVAHRFLDDFAYQAGVRRAVINGDPDALAGLEERFAAFPEFAGAYRVRPGSVCLPWGRPFEVDFALEDVGDRDVEDKDLEGSQS
ncbi:DUF4127 family protein [Sinosporangium siamense]|uniref:DUF4127 family protein n=1 Tax=Sinosporangium siamense TaxID=1367973 RepID=A0A919V705_9ACTN|nr:DUF4127 family protein [Sinosporangium siamense]GII91577.1 hypothetical protein Ssi02_18080 [Sinosporangium siamense]